MSDAACAACAACDAPAPCPPLGWWGTGNVVLCPRCVPLLTLEDREELGAAFQLLVCEEV
jgi:hypothetical protein